MRPSSPLTETARVYSITSITVTCASMLSATALVTVVVPHDRRSEQLMQIQNYCGND